MQPICSERINEIANLESLFIAATNLIVVISDLITNNEKPQAKPFESEEIYEQYCEKITSQLLCKAYELAPTPKEVQLSYDVESQNHCIKIVGLVDSSAFYSYFCEINPDYTIFANRVDGDDSYFIFNIPFNLSNLASNQS